MKADGQLAEGEDAVATEAIRIFQNQFSGNDLNIDYSLLTKIQPLVTTEDNELLNMTPDETEVKGDL
uniref:Putative ovule protein n=1 Tax=Solanum chacoense TaxID=4108 RepID=A0A0V0HBS3_SOLCH